MGMRIGLAMAVSGLLAATAPAAAAGLEVDSTADSLLALRTIDEKVAQIGHRLALANVDLCGRRAALHGLAVHNIGQYGRPYRAAAERAFALSDRPALLAVVPGGPADRSGLRADDELVSVNGRPFARSAGGGEQGSFKEVEQALDLLEGELEAGPAEIALRRGGVDMILSLEPVWGCASRFQVVPSSRHRARADGRYVQISSRLVEFARNEDELAAVLAHELAHNVLEHRQRLSGSRRNPRLVRVTEVEADRLSVYLLDRAGYPLDAPVRFWERFRRGGSIVSSATHPGWRERARIMSEEAQTLLQLKQDDPMPVPPLMSAVDSGR